MHSTRGGGIGTGELARDEWMGEEVVDIILIVQMVIEVSRTGGFLCIVQMAVGFSLYNFLMQSLVLMWVKGSQLSWASENPFHLTRYWS
jgi:hypothetical protein